MSNFKLIMICIGCIIRLRVIGVEKLRKEVLVEIMVVILFEVIFIFVVVESFLLVC